MANRDKGLSAIQITMMALGTIIGGSFFIGSAVAIHSAGPAIILSYIFGGILVYFILSALSEMIKDDPSEGSFRIFIVKAFGHGAGFVVGWVYWTGMVLSMSSEATAVSILFRKWFPGVSIVLFGSITIAVVTLINLLGADKFGKLESGLVAFKLFAIILFIIIGLLLITGSMRNIPAVGFKELRNEPLFPSGIKGIAGSMLIVMFAYAGFEVIGLSASETDNPREIIPKASRYTVLSLVGLYIISTAILVAIIPTKILNENSSPMAIALTRWGLGWAGNVINGVMFIAILSAMLAAMFGLGRMIRSLGNEGYVPRLLKDTGKVPYRGIVFSGSGMFIGLIFGFLFPRVYLFLVSSGGLAILFTYIMIVASRIKLYKKSSGIYSSWFTLISLIAVIISMPFVPGQISGFIAGLVIILFYSFIYFGMIYHQNIKTIKNERVNIKKNSERLSTEFSKELTHKLNGKYKHRKKIYNKRKK